MDLTCFCAIEKSESVEGGSWGQARGKIAAAKVLAPRTTLAVIDSAIQVYGGAGVSGGTPLARMYAGARTLRIADGPDDVHLAMIAKLELLRLRSKL
jgi:acyl-CoA dehydrogenase